MNKKSIFLIIVIIIVLLFVFVDKKPADTEPVIIDQMEQYELSIKDQLNQLKTKYINQETIPLKHTNFSCRLVIEEAQYLEPEVTNLEISALVCPTRQHLKDNGDYISKDEWDTAVAFLLNKINSSDIYLVGEAVNLNMELLPEQRYFFGNHIRNVLRSEGIDWGDTALDNYWYELVEDVAIRKKSDFLWDRVYQEKIKRGYEPMFVTAR